MKRTKTILRRLLPGAIAATVATLPSYADYTEFQSNGVNYEITDPEGRKVRTKTGDLYDRHQIAGSFVNGDLYLTSMVGYQGKFYTLVELGHDSFYGCETLSTVTINAESLEEVDLGAFEKCIGLRKATISTGTDYKLGIQAFCNCQNLREVDLGYNVTSIGTSALWNCAKLEELYIPAKVTSMGDYVCSYCESLKSLRFATTKLPVIGRDAFLGCRSLTTLVLPPAGLLIICEDAFNGCEVLESLEIPNSVTNIDERAFVSCHALKTLKLGEKLETIGEGAFAGCISLESLTFGPNLREIADRAFNSCDKLMVVDLPASLQMVGSRVFNGEEAMSLVVCRAVTPPAAGQGMFNSKTYAGTTLYVPDGSMAAYAAHEEWGKFNRIAGISTMNSSVEVVVEAGSAGIYEIFNLRGERMECGRESLAPGVYIERSGTATRKIVVE